MYLDRTKAPPVQPNFDYQFLKAKTVHLKNGIPFHFIDFGEQEVLRLQFVFEAGRIYQSQAMHAAAVNELLLEGTRKHTSEEISNLFESKGAFVETEINADIASINLYCISSLSRLNDLKELLLLLKEIIFEASFEEHEVQHFLQLERQKFQVNAKRVNYVASNNFLSFLLGERHAYSNKITETDFEKIKRQNLVDFHREYYQNGHLEIYGSGKIYPEVLDLIHHVFDDVAYNPSKFDAALNLQIDLPEASEKRIELKDALQTAIRMACPVVDKNNPDFVPLFLANTILGGYFGSRLMSNLREEKGYTYGIHSSLVVQKHLAYFVISTEVGEAHTAAACKEIQNELKRLAEELVDPKELNLVKNYIRGNVLKNFDGAFAAMDRFKSMRLLGLDLNYFEEFLKKCFLVDAVDIQSVVRKYLCNTEIKTTLAGKF